MKSFKKTKIKLESQTVSEQLRSARQNFGWRLSEVAKNLKINVFYLDALEKGNLQKIPKGCYSGKFLSKYAEFLRLNSSSLVGVMKQEKTALGLNVLKKDYFSQPKVKEKKVFILIKIFKNIFLFSGALIFCFYLFNSIQLIFKPPQIEIISPPNDFITQEKKIDLTGLTDKEVEITVNGELISQTGGAFKKEISLKKGMNVLTISGRKKYGPEQIIKQKIWSGDL